MLKNVSLLIAQIIAMVFGALTVAGVSVDPAVQSDIQSQTGNLLNALAGIAVIITTLVGSIKQVWDKVRGKDVS